MKTALYHAALIALTTYAASELTGGLTLPLFAIVTGSYAAAFWIAIKAHNIKHKRRK